MAKKSDKPASSRRKQLHILYLLNDLLHHLRYHASNGLAFATFVKSLQPFLADLVRRAAAYDLQKHALQHKMLQDVIALWNEQNYFDVQHIQHLQASAKEAGSRGNSEDKSGSVIGQDPTDKTKKELPYVMPATHGDPTAPYYELPAGNMMPHIIPNTPVPINAQQVKPLHFTPGPADPKLIGVVESFLKEAEALYTVMEPEDEGISIEMDEIGQVVICDRFSGEMVSGESYYGWSRDFCEQMKRKQKGGNRRSRSSSRDRSDSPRKRPRYASSYGSRSRSRSISRSRSPCQRPMRRRRSDSYSRSRSRSRHQSHPQFNRQHGRSPSPPRAFSTNNIQNSQLPPPPPPPPLQHGLPPQPGQPFPFANPFPNGMPPLGPDGLPLPPPRPPNWQGPWPPPPPPPPPPSHSSTPQPFTIPPGMQMPFPVPPPPPPQLIQGQGGGPGFGYGNGQGSYNKDYSGRGGFPDRGGMRGRGGRGGWR